MLVHVCFINCFGFNNYESSSANIYEIISFDEDVKQVNEAAGTGLFLI